jgi:hypothetical protein
MKAHQKYLVFFTGLAFAGSLWSAHIWGADRSKLFYLNCYLSSALFTLPAYFQLLRSKASPFSWKFGAVWVFLLFMITPSLLQTDQLRYLWDGLQSFLGRNPYALSPQEAISSTQNSPPWVSSINHPELHTIYPPLSQAAFVLSEVLRRFFFADVPNWSFLTWPSHFYWPFELGWRFVLGITSACAVVLLRSKRWDLLFFHPLFYATGFANVHVDVLLIPFLVALFTTLKSTSWSHVGSASAGILVRWTPLMYLPLLWIKRTKRLGAATTLQSALFTLALVFLGIAFFYKGAQGHFFSSTKVYGEQWYFFGYLHRFLADLFFYIPALSSNVIQNAKMVCAGIFCLALLHSAIQLYRNKISLRASAVLVTIASLVTSPTLHPWYLLAVLVVGLPYLRVLPSLWIWPSLGLASYSYYYTQSDVSLVRYPVYAIVTLFLFRDLKRLLVGNKHLLLRNKRLLLRNKHHIPVSFQEMPPPPALEIVVPIHQEAQWLVSHFHKQWEELLQIASEQSLSITWHLCVWGDSQSETHSSAARVLVKWQNDFQNHSNLQFCLHTGGTGQPSVVASAQLGVSKLPPNHVLFLCPVDCVPSKKGFQELLQCVSAQTPFQWAIFPKRYMQPYNPNCEVSAQNASTHKVTSKGIHIFSQSLPLHVSAFLQNRVFIPLLHTPCWTNGYSTTVQNFQIHFQRLGFLEDLHASKSLWKAFGPPHFFNNPFWVSPRRYLRASALTQMKRNVRIYLGFLQNRGTLKELRSLHEKGTVE